MEATGPLFGAFVLLMMANSLYTLAPKVDRWYANIAIAGAAIACCAMASFCAVIAYHKLTGG
jgi:hypothetical protein